MSSSLGKRRYSDDASTQPFHLPPLLEYDITELVPNHLSLTPLLRQLRTISGETASALAQHVNEYIGTPPPRLYLEFDAIVREINEHISWFGLSKSIFDSTPLYVTQSLVGAYKLDQFLNWSSLRSRILQAFATCTHT